MNTTNTPTDVQAYECKHVTYVRAQDGSNNDLLAIKENIHKKDGRIEQNLRFIENMKRSFYVTYEGSRTHQQKKDWEHLDRLQRFECTQAQLTTRVAQALGSPMYQSPLRHLARSPYLYGADIHTKTLAKHHYQKRYPGVFTDNSVAVLDIETDVIKGHGQIVCLSVTFRNRAFLAVTKAFVDGIDDVEKKIQHAFTENLGQYQTKRGIVLEIGVYASAGKACYEAIQRAHAWKPDFLTLWNMDYDIPRIIDALERDNYRLADVFSDPSVPKRYRYAHYKPGNHFKVTASQKHIPLDISMRWHVFTAPATFYIIDSMSVYRQLRLAKQKEPSYSLDNQLNKHLGLGKLKFDEQLSQNLVGIDWHVHMQRHHRVAYTIYNLFDCIGVELFDEKLKDLAQSISVQSGYSDYSIFNSQPKRLIDRLYFFYLERNKVIATHCDQIHNETLDSKTVSAKDWIITLPSHLMCVDGLHCIKDHPNLSTLIFTHVSDLDVSAAYPSGQLIMNLSRETTAYELCKIRGVDEVTKRAAGMNLTASHVNAYEICTSIFNAPTFDALLERFEKTHL